MPQSKYTRAPGPLPRIERIPRDAFRFDNQERRELVDLLPPRLQQLGIPENFKQEAAKLSGTPQLETLAELIVALTEECITSYPTARSLMGDARANPANSKAAIHKLRTALNPFVAGWVDDETATIIRGSLDRELADRERQLAGMRRPPANRRHLGFLRAEFDPSTAGRSAHGSRTFSGSRRYSACVWRKAWRCP